MGKLQLSLRRAALVSIGGAALSVAVALAADGDRDAAFGTDGKVRVPYSGTNGETFKVAAVQPNGNILAAGVFNAEDQSGNETSYVFLATFSPTGSLLSQQTLTNPLGAGVDVEAPAVNGNGEVLLIGNREFADNNDNFTGATAIFRRYDASGQPTTPALSFSGDSPGISATTYCEGTVLFEGSKIVAACTAVTSSGNNHTVVPALIRLNNGASALSKDTAFGSSGVARGSPNGNGTTNLNPTSNSDGGFADGEVVISDGSNGYYLLAKSQTANDDDEYPLVNYSSRLYVQRFSSTGALNTNYGSSGVAEVDRRTVNVSGTVETFGAGTQSAATYEKNYEIGGTLLRDSSGRLLVASTSYCYSEQQNQSCRDQGAVVARLQTSGAFDTAFFGGNGKRVGDIPGGFRVEDLFFDDLGRLYVLGENSLGRLTEDGFNDTSFNNGQATSAGSLNCAGAQCGSSVWYSALRSADAKTAFLLGGVQDFSADDGNPTSESAIIVKAKLNDPPDTQPDDFVLGSLVDQPRSTRRGSATVTISGINAQANASITGSASSELFVNGDGPYSVGTPVPVFSGDQVQVFHTTSSLGATQVLTTLTIGGNGGQLSRSFSTTTTPADTTPESFTDFPAKTGVGFSVPVNSDAQTIGGIEQDNSTPISIDAPHKYSVGCNGSFVEGQGTINNGASVCVQVVSSASRGTTTTANLTIGTKTQKFQVTTKNAARANLGPNPLAFGNQASGTTSSTRTATLTNLSGAGSAPLTVSAFTTTGRFDKTTDTCPDAPATLAVGASCDIQVTFSPDSNGAKSGSLQVSLENAETGSVSISLSGTGTAPAPTVSFSPDSLNFGSLKLGQASAKTLATLSNSGNASLTISSLSSSSEDFLLSDSSCPIGIPVAVGASCSFNVQFRPVSASSNPRSGSILVMSNTAAGMDSLPLTGTATAPAYSASSSSLSFAAQRTGTTSTAQTVTVTNTGTASLVFGGTTKTGTHSADFAVTANSCSNATLPANGSCTISVSFTPSATGSRTAAINLSSDAPGQPHSISLSGSGTASALGVAASLAFGDVGSGNNKLLSLTITNEGSAALNLGAPSVSGSHAADFVVASNNCTAAVAPQGTCSIGVRFTPAALGDRSATLSLASDDPGSPRQVALSGKGVAPGIVFSSSSLAFGDQRVNVTSASRSVTLSNNGTSALNISGITVTGSQASEFAQTNNCPAALQPNASCAVTVTFRPSAVGARNATVNVASDAPGGVATFALGGTGVAPVVSLSGSTLAFGSQPVNTDSAVQNLTVTNTGTAPLTVNSVTKTGTHAAEFTLTNGCTAALAANASCTVGVVFRPGATGSRTATLTVATDAGSPAVALSGTGTAPAATLSATSLSFGGQPVSTTSASQTVTVTNSGQAPLLVNSATLGGTHAGDFLLQNNCANAVQPGGTCSMTVSFRPTAQGARTAQLAASTNAGSLAVNLSGTGTAPAVSLSTASLSFSPLITGNTSASQAVTLRNEGTAPLTGIAIGLAGANASEFIQSGTCAATLAAGASCSINVSFRPTSAGKGKQASLTVTTDAGNPSVALSGTGLIQQSAQGTEGGQVTLSADGGTALSFTPTATPSAGLPSGFSYPVGFFNFTASGVSPGSTVTFRFTLPAGTSANSYVKCKASGVCSRLSSASVANGVVTLNIVDNGPDDDDGRLGFIQDPGAPALSTNSSSSSGGAASPLLLLGFGLLAMMRRRSLGRRPAP